MTLSSATSTPRPLPRSRGNGGEKIRLAHGADARDAEASNSSGLLPAIQNDEAPLARRKAIQIDETPTDRLARRLEKMRTLAGDVRSLVSEVQLAADVDLLDLMRDEVGSYSRHRAAQDARTWAEQARLSIETGLMQLERALRPIAAAMAEEAHHGA